MTDTRKDFEEWARLFMDKNERAPFSNEIWQACQSLNDKRIQQLLAVIAVKDEALSACALNDIARKALSLPHDSVRLVEVYQVGVGYIPADRKTPPDGTKLYTIVKGAEG